MNDKFTRKIKNIMVLVMLAGILIVPLCSFAIIGLTATLVIGNEDTSVRLNWDSVGQAVYYQVYRDDTKIDGVNINLSKDYTGYTDEGLTPGSTYNYKVIAVDEDEEVIDQSVIVSCYTRAVTAPILQTAVFDMNTRKVKLTWQERYTPAYKTVITNSTGSVVSVVYGSEDLNYTTFSDSLLSSSSRVAYYATNYDEQELASQISTGLNVVPITMTSVTAGIVSDSIRISWTSATNISYFKIERSTYDDENEMWGTWQTVSSNASASAGYWNDVEAPQGLHRYRLSLADSRYTGTSNITSAVKLIQTPKNLKCDLTEDTKVQLTWENGTLTGDEIRVYRGESVSQYGLLETLSNTAVSYLDGSNILPSTTYYYKIVAYGSVGNYSATAYGSITTSTPVAPDSIELLINSATSLDVVWADRSNNETNFKVERKVDDGVYAVISSIGKNLQKYTDSTLEEGKTYLYRVRAYNPWGYSEYSSPVSYSVLEKIIAPTELVLKAEEKGVVELSWKYPEGMSSLTVIERKEGLTGEWSKITQVAAYLSTYKNTGLKENTKYYYRVKALIGSNIYSAPFPTDGSEITTQLLPPLNLTVSRISKDTATLNWTDQSSESTFVIERKEGDGSYAKVGETGPNVNSWTDLTAYMDGELSYRVLAKSGTIVSQYSNKASLPAITITAPTNLGYMITDNYMLTISWQCDYATAAAFVVEKKDNEDDEWAKVTQLSPTQKSYSTDQTTENSVVYYRVGVMDNRVREYEYSDELEVDFVTINQPSELKAKANGSNSITLSWKDNSDNEDGFIVYRYSENMFKEIEKVNAGIIYYEDAGLQDNAEYYYRICAYQGSNIYSPLSNRVSAKTEKLTTIKDISKIKWARESITKLYKIGVIDKKNLRNGNFEPNNPISRAEFVSMIVRAASLKYKATNPFRDTKATNWYYKDIVIAKAYGIVKGDSSQMFNPDAFITREEIALITVRVLNLIKKPIARYPEQVLSGFVDASEISKYALPAVASIVGEGIIQGKSKTRLQIKSTATNAEGAVMVDRIMIKIASK